MIRLLIAILLPITAFATVKPDLPQKPEAPSTLAAQAEAEANAAAIAAAKQGQIATGGEATGVGKVNVAGDSNDYDAKALALGQIRAYAAPAVIDTCLIHTRGGDITVGSLTGGTKYDKSCADRKQCFAVADRLASWGHVDAAVEQLKTCDKASFNVPATKEAVPTKKAGTAHTVSGKRDDNCASKEYVGEVVDRALKTCASK